MPLLSPPPLAGSRTFWAHPEGRGAGPRGRTGAARGHQVRHRRQPPLTASPQGAETASGGSLRLPPHVLIAHLFFFFGHKV